MSSIAVRPKKDLEKQLFHQLAEILLMKLIAKIQIHQYGLFQAEERIFQRNKS